MLNQKQNRVLFWALCIGLFVSCGWMLGLKNGFLMDDYTTLVWEMFGDITESFTLLPTRRYNNRPVGRIFVALLQDLFGVNHQGYHIVFVLVHLVNVYLVYKITKLLFSGSENLDTVYAPWIAAGIFGIYPQSIMAVQWVSAVCDLLGGFFVLTALYAFLKEKEQGRYRVFYSFTAIISYMLTIRAKEMAVLLPLAFALLDICYRWQGRQKRWISSATVISAIWMAVYMAKLFSFPELVGTEYEQDFGPVMLVQNLLRYIGVYFDVEQMAMIFNGYNLSMIAGIVITMLALCFSVYQIWKKKEWIPIAALVCIGLMLAPVLTMGYMQHKLYLYIPSVFVGILFAAVIALLEKNAGQMVKEITAVMLILALTILNWTPGAQSFRNWWYSLAEQDARQMVQLYRMGELPEDCNVYVRGAEEEYNVFWPYGPGDCLRFVYDRNDLECFAVEEFPEEPVKPCLLIDYADGTFTEVSRDYTYDVVIDNVWINPTEDTLQIAVSCQRIFRGSQIEINGKVYPTVTGETFISAEVSKTELNLDEPVSIAVVVPEFDARSDAVQQEVPVHE